MKPLDVEIFAIGKWNGLTFRREDLEEIAANFEALREVHKVPLKFGHNEDQPLKDGFFALGWVDKVWVADGKDDTPKLFGRFVDIPKVVLSAIEKKLYRRVSIELDMDVEYKGRKMNYVLSGVALLGAELPAVNTIADLQAYLSRDADFVINGRQAQFSAVKGSITQRKHTMEIDQKEYERLVAAAGSVEKFERQLADAKKAADEAKAEAEKQRVEFERKEQERQAEAKKQAAAIKRTAFKKILDEAVKAMQITPAQSERFSKALSLDNDDRVLELAEDDIKAMLPEAPKGFARSHGNGQGDGDLPEDTGEALDLEVRKIIANSGGKVRYSRALEMAMQANPELAKAHVNAAGTIE